MPAPSNDSVSLSPEALLAAVVRALDGKKAEDLKALHVTAQSSITDYLVLATGTSDPHLRALRVELEKVFDAVNHPIAGMETSPGSGWLVVDAFQIMVHVFDAEQRANYRLEQLWKDAESISIDEILHPEKVKPKVAKKVGKPKASAKKVAPVKQGATATKKAATKKVAAKKATTKKVTVKKAPADKPAVKKTVKRPKAK